MRTFKFNKLCRDLVPSLMEKNWGSKVNARVMDDDLYKEELDKKLKEEAEEVTLSDSREERVKELADIYEVLESMIKAHSISIDEIKLSQKERREHRGGFTQKIYIGSVSHPEESEGEAYCFKDPTKYPEVL